MNAGDLLFDDYVLEQIFKTPPKAQILYGDTLGVYQGRTKRYPALPLSRLIHEMAFCHQSALIRRELLMQHPYNTAYKICADHEFFLSMYLEGRAFEYRPLTVSVYEVGGYSDQNQMAVHREQKRMRQELRIARFSIAGLRREIVFYMKQGIKALLGQRFVDLVRKNW